MLEPVKVALGEFMGEFYSGLVATTRPMQEFVNRGLSKSIAFAPARMVDSAEDMLRAWLKADKDAQTSPPLLPAIIVALAKDYTPTGRDFTRQVADRMMVTLPGDEKERIFGLRAIAGDVRAQIVIFASDEPSARSIASQFLLYIDETMHRRFYARWRFAGIESAWPVQLETPDVPATSIASEAKNLTILALDVTLKAEIPLYDAPAAGEPNDGKGTPGDADDPAGYPGMESIHLESSEAGAPINDYTLAS
jgi:hypothetical protein